MDRQDDELACWLALLQISGMGPKRLASLLAINERLSSFFNGPKPTRDLIDACKAIGVSNLPNFNWLKIEEALQWKQQPHHHILTWYSKEYPSTLKQVAASPPVLFVNGQLDVLNTKQLAMVGSRHPSDQGRNDAYFFAQALCQHGFTITSGLALGIDGASHEGALKANGRTVAVLGSGLNNIYPSQHQNLASRIAEKGALVCEFPLDAEPKPAHFPRRNRIISGLSRGVLVVECSEKSGSLITAQYALEQGRDVFAIPGSIHNPLAKGCHFLIRQGAKCIDTVQHILEEFPMQNEATVPLLAVKEEKGGLLSFLGRETSSIDWLIHQSGLSAEEVSSMLIELELQGDVLSVPGGYIRNELLNEDRIR